MTDGRTSHSSGDGGVSCTGFLKSAVPIESEAWSIANATGPKTALDPVVRTLSPQLYDSTQEKA